MRWQSDLSEEDKERIHRVVQESDLSRIYPREDAFGENANGHVRVAKCT